MVSRHQDYRLVIPSVPVGGITDVPLQLDTDAPFALRLVRSRGVGVSGFRFQTPRKAYQSAALRTDLYPNPFGPFVGASVGQGAIIYPEMVYPVGAQIICDIGNQTSLPLVNASLLFRGSKLYADGAIAAPGYPARLSAVPFTYQSIVPQVPVVGARNENQLRIQSDADFVVRYAVCDPFTLGQDGGPVNNAPHIGNPLGLGGFTDVSVLLRDEARKAYSNVPIHVDDLFGRGLPNAAGFPPDASPNVGFMAGLFTPEIYVPKNAALYLDVFRNDTSGTPVDLWFRFQGAKIFDRTGTGS